MEEEREKLRLVGQGPVTPWGKAALGLKTRKKNKPSNKLVVRKRRRISKRSRGGRDS